MTENLIKSRERVRSRAEVFTPSWVVDEMLDLLPADACGVDVSYLEPGCGHGNFLVAILRRKLAQVDDVDGVLAAVGSIYGVDICDENVAEARARMAAVVADR
jgi:type I restriction-modification system DNA methylase subunit